jgi:hypothetical protein
MSFVSCGRPWGTTRPRSPRPSLGRSWPNEPFGRGTRHGDGRSRSRHGGLPPAAGVPAQAPAFAFGYRLPAIGGAPSDPARGTHVRPPEANIATSSVWTGTEVIIWGGTEAGLSKYNSGSRYDPVTDTWHHTSGTNRPSPASSTRRCGPAPR